MLQRAVARILEAIYEADFLDVSYGYRPGRNPHQALRRLREHALKGRVNYVLKADIHGFFDHLNHAWLMKMLRLRIGDSVILRLIEKWLRAGAMVNGVIVRTEEGVFQGGPISPVLANIYLHYVLDLWFERVFAHQCQGQARLVRFADDYVACFQYRGDAERFGATLKERLGKFHLTIADGKTQLMVFGRFADERAMHQGERPGRFDFLGFTHVGGRDRQGRFAVIRIPSMRSCRRFLMRVKVWLRDYLHAKRLDQQKHLSVMLRGFYEYFSLAHSQPKLKWSGTRLSSSGCGRFVIEGNGRDCAGMSCRIALGLFFPRCRGPSMPPFDVAASWRDFWGARCGKSACRVLRGEGGSRVRLKAALYPPVDGSASAASIEATGTVVRGPAA